MILFKQMEAAKKQFSASTPKMKTQCFFGGRVDWTPCNNHAKHRDLRETRIPWMDETHFARARISGTGSASSAGAVANASTQCVERRESAQQGEENRRDVRWLSTSWLGRFLARKKSYYVLQEKANALRLPLELSSKKNQDKELRK